jgi:hypothetical protein
MGFWTKIFGESNPSVTLMGSKLSPVMPLLTELESMIRARAINIALLTERDERSLFLEIDGENCPRERDLLYP